MVTRALPTACLGSALRRWRALHRVKQAVLAERLCVAQSTVSRWEAGQDAMLSPERSKVEELVSARLTSAADHRLATLIAESARPMHLACDLSHRLLACSPARGAAFGVPPALLIGRSLWRYSSEAIVAVEKELDVLGWRDRLAPPAIEFDTGANSSRVVPIRDGRCRWTRLTLSDGGAVRLVETLRSEPVGQVA